MRHTLSNRRLNRNGNEVADCSICGPNVPIVYPWGSSNTVCKKGLVEKARQKAAERRERAKARKIRATERKRDRDAARRQQRELREEAEWLWRQIVYHRDGKKCAACGKQGPLGVAIGALQIHHIIPRGRAKRLRLDERNGQVLCAGHHEYARGKESWSLGILETMHPGVAAFLLREQRVIDKRDYEKEIVPEAIQGLRERASDFGVAYEEHARLRERAV